MSSWDIEFLRDAEKSIAVVEQKTRRQILDKLVWFAKNFDTLVPQTLGGEFADFYKLRVGTWRVKYTINWKLRVITVCYIDRRDKAYKKKKP